MYSVALSGLAATLPFLLGSAQAANLTLAQNYSGSTFFDGWTFYNGIDVNTTGNVFYQSREVAMDQGLTFINSAGNAIIKVDNTTNGAGNSTFGRNSVKLLSNASVSAGSLIIMDAVHMPFGCSVWPAFWTQGPNWPLDGEIDIVENVNLATNNRYTLHTSPTGCTHPDQSASSSLESGSVISTDCFNATNGDEGCIVQDPSTNSYGQGFASNGGGVFATLWDDEGIRIWFFERSSIPSDVPTANPDPSTWGTPTAFWPTSSCDTSRFFSAQTIIFDTTICGNFAGAADVFNPSCSGLCTDLVADPSNYNNAYFEVSYVRVFSNSTTKSSTGSGTSTGSGSSPTSGSGTSGSGAAPQKIASSTLIIALTAVLLPAAFLLTSF